MLTIRNAIFTAVIFFTSFPLFAKNTPFEQALNDLVNDANMVGMAAAVVRGGDITFMETWGVRELGSPSEITPNTTFRIASLSKGFAATLTAKLIEEGKLSINDPITLYNEDFQLKDRSQTAVVTVEDILSHQVSLPPYAYDNLLEAGKKPATILSRMKQVKPICEVGDCYAYQNVAFNMITSAIASVGSLPYHKSIETELFVPLGMSSATIGSEGLQGEDDWARSYSRTKNGTWKTRSVKEAYYNVPAAGGVNASLIDMTKWLSAQMGYAPDVISNDVLKMLQKPVVKTAREMWRYRRMNHLSDAHYGLGWRLYEYADTLVVNHSGSVEGYSAQIAFLPEQDVGMVLLTNSRTKEFWDILQLFLDSELGLENPNLMKTDY